ncbi:MAG TPA: hypothetical protein VGM93_07980, partial [Acidimicrobiales bacterium]
MAEPGVGPRRGRLARLAGGSASLLLLGLAVLAFIVAAGNRPASSAPACTKSWTSPVDGAWSDATKWTPAGVPSATDDVCVSGNGTYTVTLTASVTVNSVQVGITGGSNTEQLSVQGVGCSNSTTLTTTGEVDVYGHGRLALTSGGCAGTDAALVVGTTATVHGTLAADAGNGGNRAVAGAVVSDGTVAVDETLSYSSGSTFTNRGTVTLTQPFNVTGSATFLNDSGNVGATGSGVLRVTAGGTMTQRAGTTSGAPVLVQNASLGFTGNGSSSFEAQDNVSLSGNMATGQVLTVEGVGCSFASTVTAAGSFTNAGAIHLSSTGCAGTGATLSVPTGTLTNSGTVSADAANGGARTIEANVVNSGTLLVNQPLVYDLVSSTLTNQGAIDLATGTTLQVTGSGRRLLNQAGHIVDAGTGQVQVLSNATFTQGGGDTSGTPVLVQNGTLEFTGSGSPASFVAEDNVTMTGNIASGQSVAVQAMGCSFNTAVTTTGAFTNAGAIHLTSAGCAGAVATLDVSAGMMTSSGTISADAGNGANRVLRGNVTNTGTMTVDEPFVYDSPTTFLNQGSVTMTQPWTVTAVGGVVHNAAGSISGTGSGQLQLTGTTFDQGAGTVTVNAVQLTNGTLKFTGPGNGTFVLHDNVTLSGDLASGQSVAVEAVGCSFNTTVTTTAAFTNHGAIHLTSAGCAGAIATFDTTAGTMVNAGSLSADAGNGANRVLRGNVTNTGTMTVDEPLIYDSSTTFLNQGSVIMSQPWTVTAVGGVVHNAAGSISGSGLGQLQLTGTTFDQG